MTSNLISARYQPTKKFKHFCYKSEVCGETSIEPYKHYYSNITFVEPKHKYQFSGDWKNDKLIVLYK